MFWGSLHRRDAAAFVAYLDGLLIDGTESFPALWKLETLRVLVQVERDPGTPESWILRQPNALHR